jgi:hypothetical protein
MHLELFLVRVLIPLCPCSWGFDFFSPGTPAVFLREGYSGYVALCKVLVMVLITSFLSSVRGWSSCSLMIIGMITVKMSQNKLG